VSPREGDAKTDLEPNRKSPRKKPCSSSNRNTRDSFSIDYYSELEFIRNENEGRMGGSLLFGIFIKIKTDIIILFF
jgi:hypothetical protein